MMTTTEDAVFTRVAKVLRQYMEKDGLTCPDVLKDDTPLDSLDLDSLSVVEISLDLEEEFGADFPDEIEDWVTFGDVVNTVRKIC